MRIFRFSAALALAAAVPALAQTPVQVVAVPQLSTPKNETTSAGYTGTIARQVADTITADLRSTGDLVPLGPDRLRVYSYPEATAPSFSYYRTTGAKAVVTGYVQARPDGRITVACYVHDIKGVRELARKGFVVPPSEWKRAAHRCSDAVYSELTGRPGSFDTRIAYVAESGPRTALVKRVAVMAGDGSEHRFVTAGDSTVLSPRLSPDGDSLAYVSFTGGRPHVRLVDLESGQDRAIAPEGAPSFAPRFSPEGRRLLFSMAIGGNTDIYIIDLDAPPASLRRLTTVPGVDTAPSFSPDGSQILFESDRSGTQQLYVMRADGSDARRVSFGQGRYGSPAWSPDGELIAFTRIGLDGLRIGVMSPTGRDERIVTSGPDDQSPSWAASGRDLLFQRTVNGLSSLHTVSVNGGVPRRLSTPQGASDPDWAGGTQ